MTIVTLRDWIFSEKKQGQDFDNLSVHIAHRDFPDYMEQDKKNLVRTAYHEAFHSKGKELVWNKIQSILPETTHETLNRDVMEFLFPEPELSETEYFQREGLIDRLPDVYEELHLCLLGSMQHRYKDLKSSYFVLKNIDANFVDIAKNAAREAGKKESRSHPKLFSDELMYFQIAKAFWQKQNFQNNTNTNTKDIDYDFMKDKDIEVLLLDKNRCTFYDDYEAVKKKFGPWFGTVTDSLSTETKKKNITDFNKFVALAAEHYSQSRFTGSFQECAEQYFFAHFSKAMTFQSTIQ